MLRSFSLSLVLLSFLLASCGRPVIDRDPPLGGDTLPAGDDPVDEPIDEPIDDPGDDPVDEPIDEIEALAMTVRFREPGQHVVLNAQAGATTGDLYLVTLPSEVVPEPFVLEDDAAEGALEASARLSVVPTETEIVVSGSAAAKTDAGTNYSVAQAGPLPLEVCAVVEDTSALFARLTLTCEATMKVEGAGITAITASHANTDTWCNMVNLNGDTSLIPFTNPTVAVRNIEVNDGKACWRLDIYVGANSDDDGAGTQEADGTFTFSATLLP